VAASNAQLDTYLGAVMAELAFQQLAPEEAQLVECARRKDRAAIKLIVQQHNQRLYRIARSIMRDDSEADDVLQEAYVRAFANLDTFRGDARLSTWLARIVMNEALGRLRRRRPMVELSAIVANPGMAAQIIPFPNTSPQLSPEAIMAQCEIRALLERAIDGLPEAFRTVLVARLIEGMSIEETADLFGIVPETVKTRLHRGRRFLKQEMEKYIGPVLGDAFPFAGRRCERLTENVLERLGLN
jgi:RNA polymerase sigma-70 factor, ECF subfamily